MNKSQIQNNCNTLLDEIISIRHEIFQEGLETFFQWRKKIERPLFIPSALNLAFYLALRRRDISELQAQLAPLGLSSLGRLESKTINNIDAVISSLAKICNRREDYGVGPYKNDFYSMGEWLLHRNTNKIFGASPSGRSTRIMVTLPSEAGSKYKLVYELISRGMNVARINCAHDNEEVWTNMINNIKKAEKELHKVCKVQMDIAGPKARINRLMTTVRKIEVKIGDTFVITGDSNFSGDFNTNIVCGCSLPEIIPCLKVGESVKVDDGMVEGVIDSLLDNGVVVKVTKLLTQTGVKLKVENGLNFPDSSIDLDVLTAKDKSNLDFICENADIIGLSFVKDGDDIRVLQDEISKRMGPQRAVNMPIMAKIETVRGFENLPEIIIAAAGKNPFGIMIARGDLAVEAGYLRLAELQEEILWIGEAAHIPVVWATQVLGSMIATGIPTRAEITDAFMGGRAECVMVNKGDFLLEGVSALDEILKRMQLHQYKKTPRLGALNQSGHK